MMAIYIYDAEVYSYQIWNKQTETKTDATYQTDYMRFLEDVDQITIWSTIWSVSLISLFLQIIVFYKNCRLKNWVGNAVYLYEHVV